MDEEQGSGTQAVPRMEDNVLANGIGDRAGLGLGPAQVARLVQAPKGHAKRMAICPLIRVSKQTVNQPPEPSGTASVQWPTPAPPNR